MTLPASGSRAAAAAVLLALIAVLPGCAETGRYPVSGQQCGPDDPVQDIRPGGCIPRR